MPESVEARPNEYTTLTPDLTIRSAAEVIEFYKRAFGAQERGRMLRSGAKVAYAEPLIGKAGYDEQPCDLSRAITAAKATRRNDGRAIPQREPAWL